MIVSYDFTVLVEAVPPRHVTRKRVITAVTGAVELAEEAALAESAHVQSGGGFERKIFVSPDGRVFARIGGFVPELFTDGPEGLPFLSARRSAVEDEIAKVMPSARKSQFHPGGRIESSTVFSRVDPLSTGAVGEDLEKLDKAREEIESHLSFYVYADGEIFVATPEPFLAVWRNAKTGGYTLCMEIDLRHDFWESPDMAPVACFKLGEAKNARAYVSSMTVGKRPRVKGDGSRVLSVEPNLLTVDAAAMTLRAAALRIRENFLAMAEGYGAIGDVLDDLPLDQIILFRALSEAVTRKWDDIEGLDHAVHACADYKDDVGGNVFSWDNGGPDSLSAMLAIWNARPVDAGGVFSPTRDGIALEGRPGGRPSRGLQQ